MPTQPLVSQYTAVIVLHFRGTSVPHVQCKFYNSDKNMHSNFDIIHSKKKRKEKGQVNGHFSLFLSNLSDSFEF